MYLTIHEEKDAKGEPEFIESNRSHRSFLVTKTIDAFPPCVCPPLLNICKALRTALLLLVRFRCVQREIMEPKTLDATELHVDEAQIARKRGGWITFPFITGSMFGIALATSGALSNFIVYLIKEYNVKSIDSAQIYNIVNGCTSIAPVAGAIIADAYFGCFPVVAFSTAASLLSMILFTLTAALKSLHPSPCTPASSGCKTASMGQFAALYLAVGLMGIGTGGTRFNSVTLGANQFDEAQDQDIFFNWYFICLYGAAIIGATAIVYIQDSISWALGFGLCAAVNAISLVAILLSARYYRRPVAEGSPFTGLARAVVATINKRKTAVAPSTGNLGYYHGPNEVGNPSSSAPTQSFSILNRAALITQGDTRPDGSIAKPWRLCTVQQVEDLKALIRLLPIWSSAIVVSTSVGTQGSLTILQALTMDRSLGPGRFSIPAGSMLVFALASSVLFLSLLDRLLFPLWRRLTGHNPTPLQRIGLGQVLIFVAMAASALVETRRAGIVRSHHAEGRAGWVVPMSALWLVLPLAVIGAGQALHFPGKVAFFYQEFPASLRSTATGMVALHIAVGFYLSTAVVDVVRKVTDWLPDNINDSRLDKVYWMLAVLGMVNFGYYVLCARFYKYQSRDEKVAGEPGHTS